MQGTVKWFSAEKGYGFVTGTDGVDTFVHFSAIKAEGFRTLKQGQQVTYTIANSDKGPQAADVVVTGEATASAQ
jgi:cold shock protein